MLFSRAESGSWQCVSLTAFSEFFKSRLSSPLFYLSALFSPERIILPVRWLLMRVALDWLQWVRTFWREHGCWWCCWCCCCSTLTWLPCYQSCSALKLDNVCFNSTWQVTVCVSLMASQFFKFHLSFPSFPFVSLILARTCHTPCELLVRDDFSE